MDHVVAALCAALDSGDDVALLPLADRLEELGDSLAVGVRECAVVGCQPTGIGWQYGDRRWMWSRGDEETVAHEDTLRPELFARLADGRHSHFGREIIGGGGGLAWVPIRLYPSRSAAFLDLAAALSE